MPHKVESLMAENVKVPNDGDFYMAGKPLKAAGGLHWDQVNSRLGVGTDSPGYTLDVNGTINTGALNVDRSSSGVAATFEGTHSLGLNSIITAKPKDGTGYNTNSPYSLNAIYRADTNGATSGSWKAFSANRDGVNNFYVTNTGNGYFAGTVNTGALTATTGTFNDVLKLEGGSTTGDTPVEATNKTNTYIRFGAAGTGSDWAYLRQIGGSNAIKLALDFHDDNEARFEIRKVNSSSGTGTGEVATTVFSVDNGALTATTGTFSDALTATTGTFSGDLAVGTNKLFVDVSTSNVGIGTDSPDEKLHLVGDDANPLFLKMVGNTSKRAGIILSEDATANHIIMEYDGTGTGAGNYFSMYSDVTDWASKGSGLNFVPSTGNVGIGTTAPGYKLDVNGTVNTGALTATGVGIGTTSPSAPLHIYSNDNSTTDFIELLRLERYVTDFADQVDERGGYISMHTNDQNSDLGEIARISFRQKGENASTNNENDGEMAFWTKLNDSLSQRMVISPAGDVGIGTTSPGYTLDVNGTLHAGNSYFDNVYIGGSTSRGLRSVSGNFGTVQTTGSGAGNWEGYSIDGRYVFMSSDDTSCGIYNDLDNEWMVYCSRNSWTRLYYNGAQKLETTNTGVTISGTVAATAVRQSSGSLTLGNPSYSTILEGSVQLHKVAFAAYNNGGGDQGTNTIFPGNVEFYDIGNNYSTGTGKFTAPFRGIYHFDFHSFTNVDAGTTSRIFIFKNGTVVMQKGSTIHRHGNGISADLTLNANDTVCIAGNGGYYMYWYGAEGHNMFSGHLITAY